MSDTQHLDPEPGPTPDEGSISGLVCDMDGQALVGVRVEAAVAGDAPGMDALPVMTDGKGAFRLGGLIAEAYDIRFELGNVKSRVLGVQTGTEDLAVRMARPRGLVLDVRCAPGERLPPQIHVALERRGKTGWRREFVGRSIRRCVRLWRLRPGAYRVTVWGPPYVPVVAEDLSVEDGQPAPTVPLYLSARGCELRGQLTDEHGAASAGWLAWRPRGAQTPIPASELSRVVSASGNFSVRGLEAGPYELFAWTERGVAKMAIELLEDSEPVVLSARPARQHA